MIYVDELRDYPHCRLPYKRWCHLATDGALEELHAFAARLGLKRRWFQGQATHPHDDLVPSKRAQALRLGARAVTSKELIERCAPRLAARWREAAPHRFDAVRTEAAAAPGSWEVMVDEAPAPPQMNGKGGF